MDEDGDQEPQEELDLGEDELSVGALVRDAHLCVCSNAAEGSDEDGDLKDDFGEEMQEDGQEEEEEEEKKRNVHIWTPQVFF